MCGALKDSVASLWDSVKTVGYYFKAASILNAVHIVCVVFVF